MDEPLEEIVIQNVTVRSPTNKRFTIPITIETTENTEDAHALIDCGGSNFSLNWKFVAALKSTKIDAGPC